jgi:hypothetical protein
LAPRGVIAVAALGVLLIEFTLVMTFLETGEVQVDSGKLALDAAPENEVAACVGGDGGDVVDDHWLVRE